ncbi:hypothetical protein WNY51_10315 [Pseudocolwellia sp. AS88]|uniref:hypothetical protein n=1 Tax=Pseudocolwellia sp. AS88 TaxID=3063958 RepID=UPI0026E91F4C|nr:hypothetical protein [Pseudocolwellia sp. AS88]MDO7084240.1 hypothetical protein [Pseudocolwellia sp. AS88]
MNLDKRSNLSVNPWFYAAFFVMVLMLSACGSSDDDDSTGDIRFYNLSPNAPAIYLTIDEDLDDEDDDAYEKTYTGIEFLSLSSATSIENGDYFYEIAFQNDDSTSRDDLEILLEGSLNVVKESTQLLVLNGDVSSPELLIYNVPTIDDDDDADDDLFNLQVLNMFASDQNVAMYMSKDDETFNEAVFVGEFSYQTLSDNQKFDQETYIFYLADVDTNEVLFESDEITFSYATQYIITVRANITEGGSPYTIDLISTSSITEYIDINSQSTFKAYNAIKTHELLPEYQGDVTLTLENLASTATTSVFSYGSFSEELVQESGDYSVMITNPDTGNVMIENHLLTLPEDSDKTIFFYIQEDSVDADGDGDIDENNDGQIDEIEITIQSLVVDNSNDSSIYDHKMTSVNFIDSDDFSLVRLYYVKNSELIDTTSNEQSVSYGDSSTITLLNNTYIVYVVAQDDSSELILTSFELILDEDSVPQYIILENDDSTATGYRATLADQ